ncbi:MULTISPECIES: type I restriction-modification system endonuclease [Marinomonas]|uniref:Type I restriction-modification system endonuclease n=1 Tax=Marinomonas rhodophyticola TaxID=2992803 RepID=A0ABT3KBJ7_9GAMM|nr:type I restriction-modification system endonuclease [Marinomonas sp. KJ51-3]MCW4627878.1 type I restriction-modification system endonuclease [Marinomonas sp. KJ51-3]
MTITQSNFAFLKGHNDFLLSIAQAAENNYPDDPNTTLVKLRIFGESVANHLGKIFNIEPQDTQFKLLAEIQKKTNIDENIINVFHKLRTIGNDAVHKYHNDLNDAEMCLRLAFRLALWYYRLTSSDKDFAAPLFQLPSQQNSQAYLQEIAALKDALAQAEKAAEQQEHKSQAEIDAQQRALTELQGRLSVLESDQQETQAQSEARIAALETQLKAKEDELAKLSEPDRHIFYKTTAKQASQTPLNLDEQETRYLIDEQLRLAGWDADTQHLKYSNGTRPVIGRNMAIAEWPTGKDETGKVGFADYVLFAGLIPVGVVEAKRYNQDVADKLNEAYRYSKHFDLLAYREELAKRAANDEQMMAAVSEFKINQYNATGYQIPFCFSANGRGYSAAVKSKSGIWYRDTRLATNQPDALPQWFTPKELLTKLEQNTGQLNNWFATHQDMSELGLRYYQEDAVRAVENAVVSGKRSALLAMATGTGKTRTAIAIMYRMIQSQRFKRVLFLVDRRSLGEQALASFDDTRIQEQSFNRIFNIKGLTDRFPEDSTKIHVATVQSLVKRVLQSDEFIPVGLYDAIIIDEAHRGYILDKEQTEGELAFRDQQDYISAYRRVIDQFDAFKLALTATPALHTTEIFGRPIFNYSYRTAVIDGYLNDYQPPIKINTELNTKGIAFAKGQQVQRLTVNGDLQLDQLEDEQNFEVDQFNKQIIAPSFTQAICQELTNWLDPNGQQKTLIFCVNNEHADAVVDALREAFRQSGNPAFANLAHNVIIKITGNSDKDANKVQSLITRYEKDRLPNIVVTVDLLTTGIDVPSICNLVFLRKVRSRILYEQMKGRATRLCPDIGKTNFRIFDAVDLYRTLESVDTMQAVVVRPEVSLTTLVAEISDDKAYELIESNDQSFAQNSHEQLVSKLQRVITQANYQKLRSRDVEQQIQKLDERLKNVTRCSFAELGKTLKSQGARVSAQYFAELPNLVEQIEDLKRTLNSLRDRPIFTDIADKVIGVETLYGDYNQPDDFLDAFDRLVRDNINQLAALDAVVNRPRDLTRKGLVELQEWFDAKRFDESALQTAWKQKTNQDIAAKLVGHIRRASMKNPQLLPFDVRVDHALEKIKAERDWNAVQVKWLDRLASSIKDKVVLDDDVYKIGNYRRDGGKRRLQDALDNELDEILQKFNEYIWDELA